MFGILVALSSRRKRRRQWALVCAALFTPVARRRAKARHRAHFLLATLLLRLRAPARLCPRSGWAPTCAIDFYRFSLTRSWHDHPRLARQQGKIVILPEMMKNIVINCCCMLSFSGIISNFVMFKHSTFFVYKSTVIFL